MRFRLLLAAIAIASTAAACGGGDQAAATPTPASTGYKSGILQPIDRTRDTVNQLNNQQNQLDQQTGGGTAPTYP